MHYLAAQVSVIEATVDYVEQDFKLHEEVRCGCPPEDPNIVIADDARLDCQCDNPAAGFYKIAGNETSVCAGTAEERQPTAAGRYCVPDDFSGYSDVLDPNFHICYEVRFSLSVCTPVFARPAHSAAARRIWGVTVNCMGPALATCASRPQF